MGIWMKAKRITAAFVMITMTILVFAVYPVSNLWAAGNETYTGQVQKDGGVISVNLTIKQHLTPGKEGAVLSYGGNRMCTCQGIYEGVVEGKKTFSLMSRNGGSFCDKIDLLEIKQESAKDVAYTARSKDKKTFEEGKLSKTAK